MKWRVREHNPKVQVVEFSNFKFNDEYWLKFEYKTTTIIPNLPKGSHVYGIIISKEKSEILVYIGCTKNLQSRFMSHTKLGLLHRNRNKSKIFIILKQFSYNHLDNAKIENNLIHLLKPALNRENQKGEFFTENEMWAFLGIDKVNTGRDLMKKWMEEKRQLSLNNG